VKRKSKRLVNGLGRSLQVIDICPEERDLQFCVSQQAGSVNESKLHQGHGIFGALFATEYLREIEKPIQFQSSPDFRSSIVGPLTSE
jgi:hypothetical protein